jgi:hypothetical protein
MAFIYTIHSETSDSGKAGNETHQPNLTYAAIGAAVLAGLFLPIPNKIIDMLVILSLSLTAAVAVITMSAKTVSEVSGFDRLIQASTIFRCFLLVICCRLILTDGNAGVIVGFLNRTIMPDNKVGVILILLFLASAFFIFICKASIQAGQATKDFLSNIVPVKHSNVEKELSEHLIEHDQAKELYDIIKHEQKTFVALKKASRYIYYDGIIEFIFILLCLIGGIIIGAVGRTFTSISTKTYISLTLGTVITIQMSGLVSALAFKFLVQKKHLELGKSVKSNDTTLRRKDVVCRDVSRNILMKNQVEEKASMRSPIKLDSETKPDYHKPTRLFPKDKPIALEVKWVNEQNKDMLWSFEKVKDRYDDVTEMIKENCKGNFKTILMGANSPKILPVTVPTNTAIKLAKEGRKCLLIDLDYRRDSIAKVFELYKNIMDEHIPSGQTVTGIPTCVQNLWLYPACWLTENSNDTTQLDSLKINQIITHLKIKYDHLIVYSPDLNKHQGCELIGECIDGAMLFGNDSTALIKTFDLLERFECEILKPEQMPVKVSQESR